MLYFESLSSAVHTETRYVRGGGNSSWVKKKKSCLWEILFSQHVNIIALTLKNLRGQKNSWLMTLDSWLLTLDSWLLTLDSWLMTLDSWLLTLDSWLLTLDSYPLTLDSWLLTHVSWLLILEFWLLSLDSWISSPDRRRLHQPVFSFVWQGSFNCLKRWFWLSDKVVPIVQQNLAIGSIRTTFSGKYNHLRLQQGPNFLMVPIVRLTLKSMKQAYDYWKGRGQTWSWNEASQHFIDNNCLLKDFIGVYKTNGHIWSRT